MASDDRKRQTEGGARSWWRRFGELPNDSALKTIVVTMAVALIGSVLVAGSAVLLRPWQIANKEAERQIRSLERKYPDSRWVKEAQVLQIEHEGSATDLADTTDESGLDADLRMFALAQLMDRDPERALTFTCMAVRLILFPGYLSSGPWCTASLVASGILSMVIWRLSRVGAILPSKARRLSRPLTRTCLA